MCQRRCQFVRFTHESHRFSMFLLSYGCTRQPLRIKILFLFFQIRKMYKLTPLTHGSPQVARPGQHGSPRRNLVAPGYRAPVNFEPCNTVFRPIYKIIIMFCFLNTSLVIWHTVRSELANPKCAYESLKLHIYFHYYYYLSYKLNTINHYIDIFKFS